MVLYDKIICYQCNIHSSVPFLLCFMMKTNIIKELMYYFNFRTKLHPEADPEGDEGGSSPGQILNH